ncbi:orotate phosphoribosyltransferase [Candidatus Woesearchaeota archaeon]|nr:orotate phosphoribosyltransferase [Candidatus Woesearchaeota archaeon]MBT5740495.1 orotate phosphoribosyltransferase [Candidatus Woesearchaeota archaeon]
MERAKQVAKILLRIKAVKLSINPSFTYSSGIKSPIYCDNRLIPSYPEEREKIISAWEEVIKENNIEFDVIAGTATAGIPWASFLAYKLNKPMVYVRSKPKGHGAGKQVEGTMHSGSRVLIVKDLISTGGSSLSSAQACQREHQAEIVGVLAIFNYQLKKSVQQFKENNISLFALSNFSTLVDVATENNFLPPEDKANVLAWNHDPHNWGQ